MTNECHAAGVFALPVVYPAVPLDAPRLRMTITYDHSREDIDFLIETLTLAARKARVPLNPGRVQ